ncbi:MAG: hypothetical protein KQH67_08035 [Bacteroidetes bacterium]|nr:hypothetical protein [Bacteroidota bacterium]
MKSICSIRYITTGIFITMAIFLLPMTVDAQRIQHRAPSGGGNNRAVARPAGTPNRSINGGSQRPTNYNTNRQMPSQKATRPSQTPSNRQATPNQRPTNKPATNDRVSTTDKNRGNINNSGNRGNASTRDRNTNINVNNNRNVNVNRNIYVRPAPRPYPRPPYVYGGYRYNCYHPYHYHPYRPYYWGPTWHPWGFFVTTVAVTTIIVSVNNQKYYYDQGVYYAPSDNGYTVVQAPVGATVSELPPKTETIMINETTNNYYYGGTYYEKSEDGYTVVPPTAGAVVEKLPEGGEEVRIGDVTYVKVEDVYYQPIVQDGENMYEVVDVEPAE